jgi:hypothetical protein
LEPLKGLTILRQLDLRWAKGIASLEPLKELTNLSQLNLSGATGITSLQPLRGLQQLNKIYTNIIIYADISRPIPAA